MEKVVFSLKEQEEWHSRLPKRAASAGIILEDDKGRALILKAGYKNHWSFPGGVVEDGETPLIAALRETEEEAGLVVDKRDVAFFAVASRHSRYWHTYQFMFRAPFGFHESDIKLQPEEIVDFVFVSKEEVLSNNRIYAAIITNWAKNEHGYLEHHLVVPSD